MASAKKHHHHHHHKGHHHNQQNPWLAFAEGFIAGAILEEDLLLGGPLGLRPPLAGSPPGYGPDYNYGAGRPRPGDGGPDYLGGGPGYNEY